MEKKLAFIGSGMVGAGLAANALLKGYTCMIYDVIALGQIEQNLRKVMDILVEANAATREAAAAAMGRAGYTNDLTEAVSGAIFAQECVPERLELKQSIYRQIQEVCGLDILIASSTSSMMPSALQEGALYPQGILVGHPYNPSYLLPLIEVCGSPANPLESITSCLDIYRSIGKVPIHCKKEVDGFLVNKLSWGAMNAAKEMVLNGVCSVEDIDKAIMYGPGMRMAVTGQILTMSLGIQGGLRAAAAKYGKEPNEADYILAYGVDQEIAHRSPAQGNTVESAIRFRDKFFAAILKEHGLL